MKLEEANCVADRLNAVFAGSSSDIPTAAQLHEAITLLAVEIATHGGGHKMPAGITTSQAVINATTAKEVDALREYANAIIRASKEKQQLEQTLSEQTKNKLRVKL